MLESVFLFLLCWCAAVLRAKWEFWMRPACRSTNTDQIITGVGLKDH